MVTLRGKGNFVQISKGFELSRQISIAKYVMENETSLT